MAFHFVKPIKHRPQRVLRCACDSRFFKINQYDTDGLEVECPMCGESAAIDLVVNGLAQEGLEDE